MASDLSRFFRDAESAGIRFIDPATDPPLGPALKYDRNPIHLAPAPTAHICHPQVVYEAGRFWMLYVHYDEVRPPNACLELATSTDGLEWEVHPDSPVLTPSTDAWDAWRTSYHSILKVADTFYLYYTGIRETFRDYGIGLATSKDLIHWERHPDNPLLVPLGFGFEKTAIQVPCVCVEDGTWHLYYLGMDGPNGHIGHATSSDGIRWHRDPANPVLSRDESSWDSLRISPQNILKHGSQYHLFYCGYSGDIYSSAIATSNDLSNWRKYDGNPIFTVDRPKSWESLIVDHQFCLPVGDKYYVWYSAADDITQSIGLAFLVKG